MTTMNNSGIIGIRAALIQAHQDGNRRAIDTKLTRKLSIGDMDLEIWKTYTDTLRGVIEPYVIAKMDNSADPKEVKKLRGKIFPAWRKCVKEGEEDKFHPNLKLTDFDVDTLVGLCETWMPTAHGTAWTVRTATKFRQGVEAYLGCKMAQNAVLTDDDRDTIDNYEKAEKLIKRKNEELHGKTDAQGNHTCGILENLDKVAGKIAAINKVIAQTTGHLKGLPADSELFEFLQGNIETATATKADLTVEKQTLENQKKQAEEKLAEAEEIVKTTKGDYVVAIAKIKEIEA